MESAASGDSISAIRGDPAAFEVFYRAYVNTVTRFVARRVNDPHLVADLTAEIFLAVIESAHTYRPDRGSPVAWLFGVARHVVATEQRRAHRELHANRRLAGRRLVDAADIARLEERIDAESAARHTFQLLADLPAPTRALLELIAVDGLTVPEAAAALNISQVTARVRLHRARKALRHTLVQPHPALA